MSVTLGADVPAQTSNSESEEWMAVVDDATESVFESPTPITDILTPRRRGRPPGSKNKPKPLSEITPSGPRSIEPAEAAFEESLPRRPRGRPRKIEPSVSASQIADIVLLAHTTAAAFIGPEVKIEAEDARKIGDAMVPVMQDFGIVVASKIVHLVVLFAAIGAVEIPVVMRVVMTARAQAMAARSGVLTMKGSSQSTTPTPDNMTSIARALGLEVGTPNAAVD